MFSCATFVAGAAAALLLAADTPALASSPSVGTGESIYFSCDPETDAQLCGFVRDVLETAYPNRLSDADAHNRMLQLVIETHTDTLLSGHLRWQFANASEGRSETLTLTVLDAPINEKLMRGFARDLVHHSNLPF